MELTLVLSYLFWFLVFFYIFFKIQKIEKQRAEKCFIFLALLFVFTFYPDIFLFQRKVESVFLSFDNFSEKIVSSDENNMILNTIARDYLILKSLDKNLSLEGYFYNTLATYKNDWDVYHNIDHWATPIEYIKNGGGDCEDEAIFLLSLQKYIINNYGFNPNGENVKMKTELQEGHVYLSLVNNEGEKVKEINKISYLRDGNTIISNIKAHFDIFFKFPFWRQFFSFFLFLVFIYKIYIKYYI